MKLRGALAEFLGTAGLLLIVVGSGIMGESLSGGNPALALLANSLATGAGLFGLIQTFGPVSGGHFNPVVSFVEWRWERLPTREFLRYVGAQFLGGVVGVLLAHYLFGQNLLQSSTHDRAELRLYVSEVVATAGLILVIALSGKRTVEATPLAVALYVTAAYWFTSSTAFANPAVTFARCWTETFAGIHWHGAPGFILAQIVGTLIAFRLAEVLAPSPNRYDG